MLRFYQLYPAKGFPNLGSRDGYWDHLTMYCALGFDKKGDVSPLYDCSKDDGLFVWSKESIDELSRRGDSLQKLQLMSISYLWEIFYDLALGNNKNNVSSSPGFENLGLQINREVSVGCQKL